MEGAVTFTDCRFEAGIQILDGPVVIDQCDINGWFGVTTNNTDSNKLVALVRDTKIVGPPDDDTMRLGGYNWGDMSVYATSRFERSIIYSPYISGSTPGAHFDLIQFNDGHKYDFDHVVFSLVGQNFGSDLTNYINNGEGSTSNDIRVTDCWFEGGPVGYLLADAMTLDHCFLSSSTNVYGWIYPGSAITFTSRIDENGAPVTG